MQEVQAADGDATSPQLPSLCVFPTEYGNLLPNFFSFARVSRLTVCLFALTLKKPSFAEESKAICSNTFGVLPGLCNSICTNVCMHAILCL